MSESFQFERLLRHLKVDTPADLRALVQERAESTATIQRLSDRLYLVREAGREFTFAPRKPATLFGCIYRALERPGVPEDIRRFTSSLDEERRDEFLKDKVHRRLVELGKVAPRLCRQIRPHLNVEAGFLRFCGKPTVFRDGDGGRAVKWDR